MLEVAQRCVSGTKEAIAAAFHRRLQKVILSCFKESNRRRLPFV